jgi:hypothetical protein
VVKVVADHDRKVLDELMPERVDRVATWAPFLSLNPYRFEDDVGYRRF